MKKIKKQLPIIFSFFAVSPLLISCAQSEVISFKNEEKRTQNNLATNFLNKSLASLLDSVYQQEPAANETQTSQTYKAKQTQKNLQKDSFILEQINLDTNKTLEELKYSFSFVNPAVFVNDRFYDSKLTIVFSKNNIWRNFTKNWLFILQNIDKFYFAYNPYKGKYISFKDEDKDFDKTSNKFITFENKNFDFYKFKQFSTSNYYTNEYVYYLVYDNNKIIKLWTFEKDNAIFARLDFEVLVFDKPISSLGLFLTELNDQSKNFEQNILNKKIQNEQNLLLSQSTNSALKPVLFHDGHDDSDGDDDGGDVGDSDSGGNSRGNNSNKGSSDSSANKNHDTDSDSDDDYEDLDADDPVFDDPDFPQFKRNEKPEEYNKRKIAFIKKWKAEHPNATSTNKENAEGEKGTNENSGDEDDEEDDAIFDDPDFPTIERGESQEAFEKRRAEFVKQWKLKHKSNTQSNPDKSNNKSITDNNHKGHNHDHDGDDLDDDDDDDIFSPKSKLTLDEKLDKIKENLTIEFNNQATQREKAKYEVFKDSYYLTLLSSLDSLAQKWGYKRFAFRDVVTSVIQLKRNFVQDSNTTTETKIQQTSEFDKFINHDKDVLNQNETLEEKTTKSIYEVIKKAAYNNDNVAWESFLNTQEGKENEDRIWKELKELQKEIPKNPEHFSSQHKELFKKLETFYSDNWLFILRNLDKFQIKFSNWYAFPEQVNKLTQQKVHHSQKFLNEINSMDGADDYYFVNNNLESIHVGDASIQSTTYKDFYIVKNNALINIKVILNKDSSAVQFNPLIYYFPKARTKLSVKILTQIFHQALYHQIQEFYDAFENDFINKYRYGFVAQMLLELKGDKNEK